MALTNFTEDEKYQKTTVEVFCSPELISGVDGELILLSAPNIFLSIAAFLGNTLILVGNLRWRRFRGDGDRTGRESLELRQPSLPVKNRTLRSQ